MSASGMRAATRGDFPAGGTPRQKLEFVLGYPALASAEAGVRSWECRLADTHLDLMAREKLAMRPVDPDERETLIGCGAALQHLRIALKHFGCLGRVALFPDLSEPALVARIHPGFCWECDPGEKLLFEAMNGSRADIPLPAGTLVSGATLVALSQAAAGERGWLDFVQSETSRQRLTEMWPAHNRPWLTEDQASARPTKTRRVSRWPGRLFLFGGRKRETANASAAPGHQLSVPPAVLGVVKTKTDDKHGWVAAGETMARTVLQAKALGLPWSFLNPMRRRDAREALRMGVGRKGFAQVIIRLGSPVSSAVGSSAAPTTSTAMLR